MDFRNANKYSKDLSLPPPPPTIPPNFIPERLPMTRRGTGSKGRKIQLLTNHFGVCIGRKDGFFYHYSVALFDENGRPVEAKGVGRKVINKAYETYDELQSKDFTYDGERSLFTLGSLPDKKQEFMVVLEEFSSRRISRYGSPDSHCEGDIKRMRLLSQSKTFKVVISYAARIPIHAITSGLCSHDSMHFQEALRILDITLRQHAAKQGCLLVRQSFFHDNRQNYTDVGRGVLGCRGFHSSFRATQGGLSLNIDMSTTLVLKPGPILHFLCENQNVMDPKLIDWAKAKRMLKNLKIMVNNIEHKITGLSDNTCRKQTFLLRQGKDANGEVQSSEITIYEYFKYHKNTELFFSADLPCINVGKPKRPIYFPVELCTLVSLQQYTKQLTNSQRAQMVEKSRQKPHERAKYLIDFLRNSKYDSEPILRSCGITIDSQFTEVNGRVLQPPRLHVGNGEDFFPQNGHWNFKNKTLVRPIKIERWVIVNFSSGCSISTIFDTLTKCAKMKGIHINHRFEVCEEDSQFKHAPAFLRVDKMFDIMDAKLQWRPQLLLCILPEKKNSDLYGPWKRRCLIEKGVATQCIAPTKITDQYITNVLLKINAKLGGMNSFLSIEHSPSIPFISSVPTLILGMDVSHGSPGRSMPSIAAVVSSRYWPLISRYRATVRTQSPKVEMIESLFQPVSDTEDKGIIRELLIDFYRTSGNRKPQQIIIFRDGVSESQFNQVLNKEFNQIIEACKHLDQEWTPKFTLIVAQKNHHTKFFLANGTGNVPPGTVIDNKICHPKNNDFYLCAHAGVIGTTRPTHYHILHDEIGFSMDDLQELVHALCYVNQRSTVATSLVAPIFYADLAAAQIEKFTKFDELSETSSTYSGSTSASVPQVPPSPRLHKDVSNSMFFC